MAEIETYVDYDRQAGLVDQPRALGTHVTVCGLGTVGSHAALELARLGIGSLQVIDFDMVEPHNLPSQVYTLADVGRRKTDALAQRIAVVTDRAAVRATCARLEGGEQFQPGPVILAVDSMAARRRLVDLSLAGNPRHPLIVDGRIGATQIQLLAFDPTDQDAVAAWRERFWFPDEQAAPLACGHRSVSFVGARVGALIAAYVRSHLRSEPVPFLLVEELAAYAQTVTFAPP